jgi:hypothetical protein
MRRRAWICAGNQASGRLIVDLFRPTFAEEHRAQRWPNVVFLTDMKAVQLYAVDTVVSRLSNDPYPHSGG